MYMKIFKCFHLKSIQDAILAVTVLCVEPSTRGSQPGVQGPLGYPRILKTMCKHIKVCVRAAAFIRSSKGSMPSKRLRNRTRVFTSCLLKHINVANLRVFYCVVFFGGRRNLEGLIYRVSPL